WSPSMANCWSCISARVERSYLSRPYQKLPSWQHCLGSRLNSSRTPAALSPGLFCVPEPVRASAIDNSPSKKQFAKKGGSREPSIARFNVALEAVRRSGCRRCIRGRDEEAQVHRPRARNDVQRQQPCEGDWVAGGDAISRQIIATALAGVMKHRKRRLNMKRVIALLFGSGIVSTLLVQAQTVNPFKLGTFQTQGRTFVGIVLRDSVVVDFASASRAVTPASNVALPADMKD